LAGSRRTLDSFVFLGLLDDGLDAFGQHVGGLWRLRARPRRRAARGLAAPALLDDVGQLVAEEAPAFVGARLPAAGCEADVASGGEGLGAQLGGGAGIGMHAHIVQFGAEAFFEVAAFGHGERAPFAEPQCNGCRREGRAAAGGRAFSLAMRSARCSAGLSRVTGGSSGGLAVCP
jgi:hypothetical protein